MTPQQFVSKWRNVALKERSASQEHFIDLCHLVGHPTPAEDDRTGESYAFEAGVSKNAGGEGFADVWKRGHFAWEYKGKHADLKKAYQQLLQYRESLENPPLLVVSDLDRIVIHTNFTSSVKKEITLALDDLLTREGMEQLKAIFFDPQRFRVAQTTQQVTETAAREFAQLSDVLRARGVDPHEASHFLIRILFCLFAEDVSVLPKGVFTEIITNARRDVGAFMPMLGDLFEKMSKGGYFGPIRIPYFNGRLFDDAQVLELDRDGIEILHRVASLDWSSIEPSIFGTLFERSLDPSKRGQLGAHYTGKEDILLVVEPVLMEPLRRDWEAVKVEVDELVEKWRSAASKSAATGYFKAALDRLQAFSKVLAEVIVLDPACGSGNFLYVALRLLLDLEKEVIAYAGTFGGTSWFPQVSPAQLRGIEKDEYAHELAQATIWIGYIQWLSENGFGVPPEPILQAMDNIERKDAILEVNSAGLVSEPPWPATDVIVGNPPFLGGNKVRQELGGAYVDALFGLYDGRVPAFADLVCYWFERAREAVMTGNAKRVGLIATNSIRGGVNRTVLDRIVDLGPIFMAWSDREWVVAGADVRVAIVGFAEGSDRQSVLNGAPVARINADLTATIDLTQAKPLPENRGIQFEGTKKGAAFDVVSEVGLSLLQAPRNPNGRTNDDVVRPWINGLDVMRRPRGMYVIDFGTDLSLEDASLYEAPFALVEAVVKPKYGLSRKRWWIHERARPEMRVALAGLPHFIVTPRVGRYRLFVFVPSPTVPDSQVIAFARSDDYFLGVLQSKAHELWSLGLCTWLGIGNDPRYTPTTTFETYPFPWPPGKEPVDDRRVEAIAAAARDLVEKRDRWLNPEGATETDLKKRTLTNLYNQRPTWLDLAHKKLDEAVFAAYGWPSGISDDEILARLLALNQERSSASNQDVDGIR